MDEDWRRLAAEDLDLLARLHDREADAAWLAHLKSAPATAWLNLRLDDAEDARAAFALFDEALTGAGLDSERAGLQLLDELAVEYANIYLNCRYQASPTESFWLDDDGLERQEPMFAARRWYHRYGIATENWRVRPDDHLVVELVFLSHLLRLDNRIATLKHAAQFLDQHLLRWIKDFSGRIVLRSNSAFYAGANLLTASYVDRLRGVLADAADEPRFEMRRKPTAGKAVRAT